MPDISAVNTQGKKLRSLHAPSTTALPTAIICTWGKIITKKAVVPTEDEIEFNKRSKSSKLRVIEKI